MNNEDPRDPDASVSQLIDEFIDRRRNGENPSLSALVNANPEVADELRELLSVVEQVESAQPEPTPPGFGEIPTKIGDHRIVAELGRGAMGIVYRTVHESLNREVAVKVMTRIPSHDSSAHTRFQQEAKTAARLHHKNIVPVFEVGEADGYCYFTMPLIDGTPLSEFRLSDLPESTSDVNRAIRGEESCWGQLARILAQIADGLAYAHENGVIHRDIKPSNLIVDKSLTPWITDFGLAKSEDLELTGSGDLPGTLRYMSPERLRGSCDERADIYGLGATAYEICTGRHLVTGTDRPSIVHEIATRDHVLARSINPAIPRDLESIIKKCVEWDPRRRYATSLDLANDLRRFANHEPVTARPISQTEMLMRWSRKHQWLALGLALSILALLIGMAGFASRAHHEKQLREAAESFREIESGLRLEAIELADLATQRSTENRQNLYFAEMNLASRLASYAGGESQLQSLLRKWSLADPIDRKLMGWEWNYFDHLSRNIAVNFGALEVGTEQRDVLAYSPSCQLLVGAGERSMTIWNVASGTQVGSIPAESAHSVHWSPDGDRFAYLTNGSLVVVARDGTEVARYKGLLTQKAAIVWMGADTIAIGKDKNLTAWNCVNDASESSSCDQDILTLRYGAVLLAEHADGWVSAWDSPSAPAITWDVGRSKCPIPSPTERIIAVARGGMIEIVNVDTQESLDRIEAQRGRITTLAWSQSGHCVASGTDDGRIKIWDRRRGAIAGDRTLLRPHEFIANLDSLGGPIRELEFAGNSQLVSRVQTEGPDQLHRFAVSLEQYRPTFEVAASQSSRQVFAWDPIRPKVWMSDRNRGLTSIDCLKGASDCVNESTPSRSVSVSLDGKRVASVERGGRLAIVDVASGNVQYLAGSYSEALTWTKHNELFVVRRDGSIEVVDGSTLEVVDLIKLDRARIRCLAYSSARSVVAVAQMSGQVLLYEDAREHDLVQRIDIGVRSLMGVAFSPDGKKLVAAHGTTAGIWGVEESSLLQTLHGHVAGVFSADWHPTQPRIATCGVDRTVRVWDSDTGRQLVSFEDEHKSPVLTVRWSPDGQSLASCEANGFLVVRSANAGSPDEQ